jgi:hypothetical protein
MKVIIVIWIVIWIVIKRRQKRQFLPPIYKPFYNHFFLFCSIWVSQRGATFVFLSPFFLSYYYALIFIVSFFSFLYYLWQYLSPPIYTFICDVFLFLFFIFFFLIEKKIKRKESIGIKPFAYD